MARCGVGFRLLDQRGVGMSKSKGERAHHKVVASAYRQSSVGGAMCAQVRDIAPDMLQSGDGESTLAWVLPWRHSKPDSRRSWGGNNTQATPEGYSQHSVLLDAGAQCARSLAEGCEAVLHEPTIRGKALIAHATFVRFMRGDLPVSRSASPLQLPDAPARPIKPQFVHPREMPVPGEGELPAHAHCMHNLLHIELSAIDQASDTCARFAHLHRHSLPTNFFQDFARIADEESRHALWCLQRLHELGFDYGDMIAHSQLWDGAQATSNDVAARVAVVPCTQEAKGLDAGGKIESKLASCQDKRSATIVRQITQEELAHVAVGSIWLTSISEALEQEPQSLYQSSVLSTIPDALAGSFNHPKRQEAGLRREWYEVPKKRRLESKLRIVDTQIAQSGSTTELERVRSQVARMLDDEEQIATH